MTPPSPSPQNTIVNVTPPESAALKALLVAVGNAAVAFGVIGVSTATTVETGVVGLLSSVYLLANSIHHKANNGS